MEMIEVRVQRAANIIGNDGFGSSKTSDPYIELTLLNSKEEVIRGELKKTKVIQKTVNPEWNETLCMGDNVDLRMATYLACTMFDKNILKDVPLGRVVIPLREIIGDRLANGPITVQRPFKTVGKMKAVTGELFLQISHAPGHGTNVILPPAAGMPDQAELGPRNLLVVTVEKGIDLPAMDSGGTSDPLVILTCNKTTLKTTTKKKTLKPLWKESVSKEFAQLC